MQSPDSQIIIARFFEALQILKRHRIIRGKQTFTTRYDIDRRNMYTLQQNHASDIFQTAWLGYLACDYKVSPMWLLTGEGEFFVNGWDATRVAEINVKPAKNLQMEMSTE